MDDPPFNGTTPMVCDTPGSNPGSCPMRSITDGDVLAVLTIGGDIIIGTWTSSGSGGGSTDTKLAELARAAAGVAQDYVTIATPGDTNVVGTTAHGILFGTPVPAAP